MGLYRITFATKNNNLTQERVIEAECGTKAVSQLQEELVKSGDKLDLGNYVYFQIK